MTVERCPRCDRPVAVENGHEGGCTCEECMSMCWRKWGNDECGVPVVDWRTRTLAAEQRAEAAERGNRELCAAVATVLSGMAMTRGQEWIRDRLRDAMERHALAPAAEGGKEDDRG